MEESQLYHNQSSRDAIKAVLKDYLLHVRWNINGDGHILDVGCGAGDVTTELLRPKFPADSKLTGCDISGEMIEHARKKYASNGVEFMTLDIGANNVEANVVGKFDNIVSFYCLQRLQDHRQALSNIYKMIKPGGNMLMSFPKSSPILDTIKQLSATQKWGSYLQGIEKYDSTYDNCADFEMTFKDILVDVGFYVYICEVMEHNYKYTSKDYKDFVKSILPFMGKIPKELHEDHLNDILKLQHIEVEENGETKVHYPTRNLVVFASKSVKELKNSQ